MQDHALANQKMSYVLATGEEVSLTPNIIRKYLVQGQAEFVTDQEVVYFMHLCKARQLNPFLNECWLIKYSPKDKAQIVESIHNKRNRARRHPDCLGWRKGIVFETRDKEIKESPHPFLPEGARLLAAYFEATPKGWQEPFRHEVSLASAIKRKKDGSLTSFWQPEKQPQQLVKVVESQGLSILWGSEVGNAIIAEEADAAEFSINVESDTPAVKPGTEIYDAPSAPEPVEREQTREPETLKSAREASSAPQNTPQPARHGMSKNWFDEPKHMIYRQPTPFYLLLMIGRDQPFGVHVLLTEDGPMAVTADLEDLYNKLLEDNPLAAGSLPQASERTLMMMQKHAVNKLKVDEPTAKALVVGDFESVIMSDIREAEPENKPAMPTPRKDLPEPAQKVVDRILKEHTEEIIATALQSLGFEQWPVLPGKLIELYEKCGEVKPDGQTHP